MSSAAIAFAGMPRPDLPGPRRGRIALGIAVSLAAHLLLLFAYRGTPFHARPDEPRTPPRSIAVWLRPPAPVRQQPAASASKASPERPRPARRVIAVPPAPASPAPERQVVQQAEALQGQAEATPQFDHEAALRTARQFASEPDPSGKPRPALQTETKLARAIARAKRRDCKDGIPGGLLAPFILLLDKKDSGCKW